MESPMMAVWSLIGVALVLIALAALVFYLGRRDRRLHRQKQERLRGRLQSQGINNCRGVNNNVGNDNVWCITGCGGAVATHNQHRETSGVVANWPTHNAHISIDSFVIDADRLNSNDFVGSGASTTNAIGSPPLYNEIDLPTYEEAVKSNRDDGSHCNDNNDSNPVTG